MKTFTDRISFLEYTSTLLPSSSICVEIGVRRGNHARQMYNIYKPTKLFLIDPWKTGGDKNGETERYTELGHYTAYSGGASGGYSQVKAKFSKQIKNKQVILKKGFSYDVVDSFPNDFFDLIYIDACHLYGCVKSDLEMFLPKLKRNGLMCGHDYMDHKGFGVVKAVDKFIDYYNFRWIAQSLDKDWAIQRKD